MRLLLFPLLVHIAYFNLHCGFVKFSKLTFEGVESNPGPWDFTIDTVVRTSCDQGYSQYQESAAGMQCTSNAYTAIIFSAIKDINFWESDDLDCILNEEDRLFKFVGLKKTLAVDELPLDKNL